MNPLIGLLGREPIAVTPDGSYLTGRTVLITGAGGSIGSEIARQVCRYRPALVVLLGHGESTLTATAASLTADHRLALGDIRDPQRLAEVFGRHRPDVVFHAAALKHVDILEREPVEAVKSNVWGTANVLQAAADAGVGTLVNISTDKAADPVGILGASKRIGERLTAGFAPRRWLSVRFGNVLGSRGSVLGVFARQIADGGPLTVTSPDATRYFMTVPEAASLVLTAGAIGDPGEALILDMGQPVRIADLAQRLARFATGADMPVIFTGLRPGERLHETLIGTGEVDRRPRHPLVTQVLVPPLAATLAAGVDITSHHLAADLAALARRDLS